ncbi:nucleoside hydrolase [Candidatus Poribacteria bacterium]|nr:MAG: nucleoside hydrolase [Candidatus Poribacteria bacterium]
MKRILIDTDPGVDDALALIYAFKSPDIKVEAITTVSGNVNLETVTRNLLKILNILDLTAFPIIAKGEAQPLVKPPVDAEDVHGKDGLGNISELLNSTGTLKYDTADCQFTDQSADDLILEMVDSYPDELIIVALGPLTNISKAIQKDLSRFRKVHSLYLMGGVFTEYGNITTNAEFNVFVDPHAAHEVFNSGVPIHIAPLDVTHQVKLTGDRLQTEVFGREDVISHFLTDSTKAVMEFYRENVGFYGFHIHDALPIGMLNHPELFRSVDAHVQVETEGELTSGMTVADLRKQNVIDPNAKVYVGVDADSFLDLFFKTILT